ncbi:hypothetical protein KDC22_11540 [Paenibacillus tritici]|uniref:hypothetical protein n=1 Tax=Paenibacillus tritici TaxID=1873425 RepID=UPI001BA5F32F|nr:hypothetical protein [Paenibacillus tritici]QUL57044.1 hypothetical protein KDC22_11540 [Paenibacillus tritici]
MQLPPQESSLIISFQKALRIFAGWGQKFSDFMHSILTKQIRACGQSDESGLYGFLFIANEVERVAKGGLLSIDDIAHEQSIYRNIIVSWTQKGFLPVKRVHKRHLLVNPIDYQKFVTLYIPARDLVKMHPEIRASEKLVRVLSSMGVEPVTGPKIDGSLGYLYKRDSSLFKLLGLKDS